MEKGIMGQKPLDIYFYNRTMSKMKNFIMGDKIDEETHTHYHYDYHAAALNALIGTGNYITGSQYNSAGRLRNQAFGNGVTQSRNYNAWNTNGGRLQNMTAGALQNLSYSYDAVGSILSITKFHGRTTGAKLRLRHIGPPDQR